MSRISPQGRRALLALGAIVLVSVPVFVATRMGGGMPLSAARSKAAADAIAAGLTPDSLSALRLDLFYYIPTFTMLFAYAAMVLGRRWMLFLIVALFVIDVVETALHLKIALKGAAFSWQPVLFAISRAKFILFASVFVALAIAAIRHKADGPAAAAGADAPA